MTAKYFNVKNGLTTGTISLNAANGNITSNTYIGNVVVTNTANLGAVGNITITGGSANYVLQTNGSGLLSWVAQSTGGTTVTVDNFTGNGVQTAFTLSTTPSSINDTIVNYNGALVLRTAYSLAGAVLTFSSPPADQAEIEITTGGIGGGGGGGTSPGGSNTYVQFNDGSSFGGNAQFTYNKTTNLLSVGNVSLSGNIIPSSNNVYSLGNASSWFKDAYIGPGSLYVAGIKIVKQACYAPFKKIMDNAGKDNWYEILHMIFEDDKEANNFITFNVKTDTIANALDEGLLDPVKVTRIAGDAAVQAAVDAEAVARAAADAGLASGPNSIILLIFILFCYNC